MDEEYHPRHRRRHSIFHLHRRHRSYDDIDVPYGLRDNSSQNVGAYGGNANVGAYGCSDNIIPASASSYGIRGGRSGTYGDSEFRDARGYGGDIMDNVGGGSYRSGGEMTRGPGGYCGSDNSVRLDGHGDIVGPAVYGGDMASGHGRLRDQLGGHGGGVYGGRVSGYGGEGGGMEKTTVMDNYRRGDGGGGDYRSYGGSVADGGAGNYVGGSVAGGLNGEGYSSRGRDNSGNYGGVRIVSASGGDSGVDEYRMEEMQTSAAKHRHLF